MRLALCAVNIFIGALAFMAPNLTRRELLFAVPVPPDFRRNQAARDAIASYRTAIVAVVLATVAVLLFSPAPYLDATAAMAPFAILLVGGFAFYRQNRKLAPAAVQFARPREAELTVAPEELPRFAWLAAGPFAILGAAAEFLRLNWSRIPLRFPVHWGANGRPNRWAERTTKGVYGPMFFGAEICAWLLIMALAGWLGSRRSRSRPVTLGIMITAEYLVGVLFALISVQPVLGMPVWIIALAPLAIIIPLVIVAIKKLSETAGPMDPTPNECWKGAIFYYNPNDSALFVEKREGWGYTFNFANRWSWVLLAGLVLVIASAPFVLA